MHRPRPLAKLSRPRPRKAILRERVFGLIDEARRAPLIWMSGPPGAGKTTAVSTYLAHRAVPVVWYQVDSGDADPASFFHYLGLTAAHGRSTSALPLLLPEHLSDLKSFTRRYFRQFFAKCTDETILVLDNFQEAADSGLSTILSIAAEEIPDDINVLIISRTQAPPVFAQMQVRGDMYELRWSSMRLTLEEARAMCVIRKVTDEAAIRALHHEADGWAAGLTLMLERVNLARSEWGNAPDDSRESVFNYFATLILDHANEDLRQMLLAVAFLPNVTPASAQALSGNSDAGRLLENLCRRHLFTERRPGAEPVYQFHALFRTFLRHKATESLAPDALLERLRCSADVLDEQGEWEAAFDLFVEARDWERAVSCILLQSPELLAAVRWKTLSRWIDSLPDDVRRSEPWVDYWYACAQAQTAPIRAVKTFEEVQLRFRAKGNRVGRVLSLAGLFSACAIDHADYATIDRWFDEFVLELCDRQVSLSVDQELAAWGALVSAAFFSRPWHDCIEPGLRHIEQLLAADPNSRAALRAATTALVVASRSGDQERAGRIGQHVERLAAQDRCSPAERAWALFQLAHHCFVKGDYGASFELFDRTWLLAEEQDLQSVFRAALTHRFMVDFRLRDAATAEASLRRIRSLPASPHLYARGLLTCYEARFAQLRGEAQLAADFAERAHDMILGVGAGFHEICYGLIDGEILLGAGRLDKARKLIERTRELVERCAILVNFRASISLVESWLARLEGREQDSLRLLREALENSRNGAAWCQMRFVDTTCAHMLPVALELGIECAAASHLIRRFHLKPAGYDLSSWPWPVRVRVLGEFTVELDGETLAFERKVPRKTLALLKFLIVHGPREVSEQQVVDALWRDEEGDAGHKALSVTLLRLRRLLGEPELIRYQGGRLSIDAQRCWVDAWAFERRLGQLGQDSSSSQTTCATPEKILEIYAGELLPEDRELAWTVPMRERLRMKFIHALEDFGQTLEAENKFDQAIAWYTRGLDADATVERFYQGLMRCYQGLDRRTDAAAAYGRLKRTLSATLGLLPSASTELLHQRTLTG